jgi:hypothetical protein
VSEAVYFHVTLEPHRKHSGKRTGRRISFLAEVPLDAAKTAAQSSDDEQLLFEEAKRLVAALTSIAMTGQSRQPILSTAMLLGKEFSVGVFVHSALARDGSRALSTGHPSLCDAVRYGHAFSRHSSYDDHPRTRIESGSVIQKRTSCAESTITLTQGFLRIQTRQPSSAV